MNTELQHQIKSAQLGDPLAYETLVKQYQAYVIGIAFSWLGDLEQAQDVSQEVFLEAHLKINQLEHPEAFAGWLRRIVIKCCDRVTRRKQLVEPGMQVPDRGSAHLDPEYKAQQDEAAFQLRHAISALPEAQRIVIALAYFADISGAEISEFLEIPITTVKKRLFDARQKLQDKGEHIVNAPSIAKNLTEETLFFIALREQNVAEMKRLIDRSPELVNAEQNWSHELAHQRVLPFANSATALIAAVELGNMDILELLLAKGADPDGLCGCATGESAVWATALFNRPQQLVRLLKAGANVNVVSAAGNTPLHIAAMRGHVDIVRHLIQAGADVRALDREVEGSPPLVTAMPGQKSGLTPSQCARAAGFLDLADEIDASIDHTPIQENCAMVERGDLLETGIRAIDFFAPLERNGLVKLQFGAGVGMLVLLGELALRAGSAGYKFVWTGFTQPPFDIQDMEAEFIELGIASLVSPFLESFHRSSEQQRASFEAGLEEIERMRKAGHQVIAVVQSTQGFEQDVEASFPRLLNTAHRGSVSTIVMGPFKDTHAPSNKLLKPYATQWVLDRTRSKKRLYPAIDSDLSLSKETFNDRHETLRKRVRDILAANTNGDNALENFDPNKSGLEKSDDVAHQLLRYFSEPLSIAMAFGGLPGTHTSFDTLVDEVEAIVASGNGD